MLLKIKITEKDLKEVQAFKDSPYTKNAFDYSTSHIRFVSFFTVTLFEIRRSIRIFFSSILSPMLNSYLYFIVFGVLLGARVAPIDGISYLTFLVPGYLAIPLINIGFLNGTYYAFMGKYLKNVQELQRAPVNTHVYLLATMVSTTLTCTFVSILIYFCSLTITHTFHIDHLGYALGIVVLSAWLFNLLGVLNGLFCNNFESLNVVPMFILTPFLYLSGLFVPLSAFNDFFAKLSYANPVLYSVSGLRYSFLSMSDVNIQTCFIMLAVFVVIAYGLAYRYAKHKLNFF